MLGHSYTLFINYSKAFIPNSNLFPVYFSKASVTQRSDIINVTPSINFEFINAPNNYPVIYNSFIGY